MASASAGYQVQIQKHMWRTRISLGNAVNSELHQRVHLQDRGHAVVHLVNAYGK